VTTTNGAPIGAEEPRTAVDRGGVSIGQRKHRSRITNRSALLPSVHPQSVWGRLMRDTLDGMVEHLGGDVTEPQRMTCRRIAVLETEMIYQEDRMGTLRAEGSEPPPELLDLYSRLSNTQRRHIEALGWSRMPRDLTPTLSDYLESKNDSESHE
jgi:hypothetical protein